MIYTTGTIAGNGSTITGTGTNFTAAGSLIRVGCTLIAFTNPVQVLQLTAITNGTTLSVTPAITPAITAGTKYAILLSDSLSVDGLAQDIAETFKMYQAYMGGFADVMNGVSDVTITINGQPVTVPGQKSLAKKTDLDSYAKAGNNNDITQLRGLTTALSIAQGGTGAKTAAAAASQFGVGADSFPFFSGVTVSTTRYAMIVAQNTARGPTDVGARVSIEASVSANSRAVILQRNNQDNQTNQIRSELPSTSGALAIQGTSGRDYKKEILPASPVEALKRVLALELVNFVYKDDEKERQRFGIIAEDAEVIAPQYIKHNQEPVPGTEVFDEEGRKIGEEYRDRPSVDNNPIVMDLIGCIHGLQKQVTEMKKELTDLVVTMTAPPCAAEKVQDEGEQSQS